MKYKNFTRKMFQNSPSSGYFGFLKPFIVPGLIFVFLYMYLKDKGGLFGGLKKLLGLDELNASFTPQSSNIEENKKSMEVVSEILGKKGITVTPYHVGIASSLYNLFNEFGSEKTFGRSLSESAQKKVYDIIIKLSPENLACVYSAYGVRSINNRQSIFLGFIWDNTEGNLIDHADRCLSGNYETTVLRLLRNAVKAYFS